MCMRVIRSVGIREKPASKGPRIRSSGYDARLGIQRWLVKMPVGAPNVEGGEIDL